MSNFSHILTAREVPAITIGGVAPFSTVDWPGMLSATVFLQGCPWRCAYCHNVDMQPSSTEDNQGFYTISEVLHFIESRAELLDGIVLSGGEPLMQNDVISLAQFIVARGLKLGLHTGGYRPDIFSEMLNYAAWIGFDYKTLFSRYNEVVRGIDQAWGQRVQESLQYLIHSGCSYEIRTTIDADHFSFDLLKACEEELSSQGVTEWTLQIRQVATKEGALIESAPSRQLIENYLAKMPHTIARLRTA